MSKTQHDAKKAADLKAALAAKPPTPGFFVNPDYVPPPVVNLQDKLETRRRPTPAEFNRDAEQQASQSTVEQLIEQIAKDTRKGLPGATQEAEEAAASETVRAIKVDLAKRGHAQKVADQLTRDQRAHEESLALIRAEMVGTIHTEDYSG